jgi:Anti-sigma-K factor rskA, C-terminal
VDPPAECKRVAMAAASRTSQLGPAGQTADRGLVAAKSRPGGRWRGRSRTAARRGVPGHRGLGGAPRPAECPPGPAQWPLARLAIAAAVLVLAGAVGITAVLGDQMRQLHQSQRQGHMIAMVLNAPDRVMLTAKIRTGGVAIVVMSYRVHGLVFTAHGMRRLPAAEGYELWLMGPAGTRPAGMLAGPAGGMADPAVVSGLTSGDMVGLTVEPAAGSQQPTSAPIVLIGA